MHCCLRLQITVQNIFKPLYNVFIIFLVPGSFGVEDALGETNPPASPVLRCLLYLVPSDHIYSYIHIFGNGNSYLL